MIMPVFQDEAENVQPGGASIDTVAQSSTGFIAVLKASPENVSSDDTDKNMCCLQPSKTPIVSADTSLKEDAMESAAQRCEGHDAVISPPKELLEAKQEDKIRADGSTSSSGLTVTAAPEDGENANAANFSHHQSISVAADDDADLNRTRSASASISSDSVKEEELLEEEESLPPSADYSLITSGSIDIAYVALEAARPLSDLPPPKVGEWVESKAAHEDAHIFRARVVARYRDLEHKWIFKLRSPDMASCYIEPLKHVRKGSVWTVARELDLAAGRKARRQSQGRRQMASVLTTPSAGIALTGTEASSPKRVSQRVSARSSRSSVAETPSAGGDAGRFAESQQRRKSAPAAGLIRHKVKRQSHQQEGLLEEPSLHQATQRRKVICHEQRDGKAEDMRFLCSDGVALNNSGSVSDAPHKATEVNTQDSSGSLRQWNVPLGIPFGTQPGSLTDGPLQGTRKRRSLPAYNHFTKLFANSSLFVSRYGSADQKENSGV